MIILMMYQVRLPNLVKVKETGKVDPKTYNEAMQDVAFWKEAINDEIGSIMENNIWVLSDLPPGCKPLGCKWIFKRKMKLDGTIDKFKYRLVIQGFRQKEGIDYFDTYTLVARITTIRLLLDLAAIHNLVIHQMDIKTTFLNGDLEEEVYMKQPEGFIMPCNEHKMCKLVKSLYGLKQAPKQWHQKFNEVVLSSGFLLNQYDKCVYSKFHSSGKGVMICLYVDDMLIFETDQNQVDKAKKFLSSKFSMKDMGEADIILESRDAIFDENHFSSIPRPKDIIPNSDESQRDDHSDDVPSETPEPRKGKRDMKCKSYGFGFQLYLVEGSRYQIGSQYSYCYSIEMDPETYNEAMQDVAFWKEAINDEIGSIMENNIWVLSDLPPGCKPLGCKWIFKRKMKLDGKIDKFKARLVIQCFRQKEGIDYFDTYTLVSRITTNRLLLALAAIHNLVIHQMDIKITFLNGDLEEEVYMKQPEGFIMPCNEHTMCKLVKSLYGLKQAHKQWHQKFYEVVLSSGFLLNQYDKCVYSKFHSSGKGVMICLYVNDMLIFKTDQNQVDKVKKFLSSKFSMKDMGEADIILEKLKPNIGKPMDQLEYSRAIGCLMYTMTSTRPDITYSVWQVD
nr:zinc finger, CCHC-type [Tanacetum cinerariifolium]